jgi:hypothetical protein
MVIVRRMFISHDFSKSRRGCAHTSGTTHTTAGRRRQSSPRQWLSLPLPTFFRLSWSRLWPASASFTLGNNSWRQVRRIRRVPQHLDVVIGDPVFDNGRRVHRRIVPMKPPLVCTQFRLLFPQMPQKRGQDRDNVIGIHRLALGYNGV